MSRCTSALSTRPWKRTFPGATKFGQRSERCFIGPGAGDVEHAVLDLADRADGDVDALLRREPPGDEHAGPGRRLDRDVVRLDEVRDVHHAPWEHACGTHPAFEEPARTDEDAHRRVGAGDGMNEELARHHRARGQGVVLASAQDRVLEMPAQARLAEVAVIEELIRGARELVVVQRHHRGDPPPRNRPQHGRRQLVIDVVHVYDVRAEVLEHRIHPTAR